MHGRFVICWFILVLGLFNCCYMYAASTLCRSRCAVGVLTLYYLLFTTYSLLLTLYYLLFTTLCRSRCAVGVYDIGAAWVSRPSTRELLQYYLLFTTYSLLLTLYYLLFTTYSLLLSSVLLTLYYWVSRPSTRELLQCRT